MARCLICEDHPLFRAGLRQALEACGAVVVGEVGDGERALEAIRQLRPEVVLLDLSMPVLDGLEVLAQAQTWPDPPLFIVLTMHDRYAPRATELGAHGYLLKEDAISQLAPCLESVLRGRRYLSPTLRAQPPETPGGERAHLSSLTDAERRVLRLVAQHRTSREIAALLHVSPRTVQNHRANMVRKLGLTGSQALLRFALDHRDALDLIDGDPLEP